MASKARFFVARSCGCGRHEQLSLMAPEHWVPEGYGWACQCGAMTEIHIKHTPAPEPEPKPEPCGHDHLWKDLDGYRCEDCGATVDIGSNCSA